jgi:hypothetical protein
MTHDNRDRKNEELKGDIEERDNKLYLEKSKTEIIVNETNYEEVNRKRMIKLVIPQSKCQLINLTFSQEEISKVWEFKDYSHCASESSDLIYLTDSKIHAVCHQ